MPSPPRCRGRSGANQQPPRANSDRPLPSTGCGSATRCSTASGVGGREIGDGRARSSRPAAQRPMRKDDRMEVAVRSRGAAAAARSRRAGRGSAAAGGDADDDGRGRACTGSREKLSQRGGDVARSGQPECRLREPPRADGSARPRRGRAPRRQRRWRSWSHRSGAGTASISSSSRTNGSSPAGSNPASPLGMPSQIKPDNTFTSATRSPVGTT